MQRYKDDRRTNPLRGEARGRVAAVLVDARVALREFRALTGGNMRDARPLDPVTIAICGAEHYAVLACMHADRGASHVCVGYVWQAIRLESGALGADGPLRPVLLRLLDAFDRSSATAN
jgi:hypothetical protein